MGRQTMVEGFLEGLDLDSAVLPPGGVAVVEVSLIFRAGVATISFGSGTSSQSGFEYGDISLSPIYQAFGWVFLR